MRSVIIGCKPRKPVKLDIPWDAIRFAVESIVEAPAQVEEIMSNIVKTFNIPAKSDSLFYVGVTEDHLIFFNRSKLLIELKDHSFAQEAV